MLPSINTEVLPFNLCISLLFSKSSEENRRPENNKKFSKNHAGSSYFSDRERQLQNEPMNYPARANTSKPKKTLTFRFLLVFSI